MNITERIVLIEDKQIEVARLIASDSCEQWIVEAVEDALIAGRFLSVDKKLTSYQLILKIIAFANKAVNHFSLSKEHKGNLTRTLINLMMFNFSVEFGLKKIEFVRLS